MALQLSDPRQAWLALSMLDGLGPRSLKRLLGYFPSAVEALDADFMTLQRLGVTAGLQASIQKLQQGDSEILDRIGAALDWLDAPDCHLLHLESPGYPPLLREIADPPPVLFVRGNISLLTDPQLAMVGTRHPGPHGAATARAFARSFTESGLVVTSGMALGIDGACHQGALDVSGQTIAVWGTGLDNCYPKRHRRLADDILANGGALVSELAPAMGPHASQFPRRNRIISGLSLGTLVVEASLNSGSLITARLALEQNREVFAMPGSIHNTQARGCHRLLRDGATLVETVQDVLDVLRVPLTAALAEPAACDGASPTDHPLDKWLSHEPVSADWLSQHSGLPVHEVLQGLLELELEGIVQQTPHGYSRR
ncbi:DNA-protecting protein DprA [Pseudomonas sp. gcc21]|uniref:DNA-processing protein DprA n=1 Tax=Pseudomonas sp. gcc21 TaxID=2726989 RepID=UPI0014520C77|nr:DNA-processing protein DprA [Pseudomonas sp. gcc21]QJD59839.1 DNA-protecting protein DprA [Pseudomonas sp. gcc21]